MINRTMIAKRRQRGFTLVELLVSVAILVIVFAVVLNGIAQLQRRNSAESSRVDITQETRDFMDQVARDVHQLGYPGGRVFPAGPAAGFVTADPYQLVFQADVDGTGIQQETVRLVDNTGALVTATTATCPCTIQRGVVPAGAAGAPVYYTEVNNIQTAAAVFTAFQSDGTAIALPTANFSKIATIAMSITVQSPNIDAGVYSQNKVAPTVTMSSEARIMN